MTIERVRLSDVTDARQELATKAADILGYRQLVNVVSLESLATALRRLEIEPLKSSSVEKYKARKARPGIWSGKVHGARMLLIAIASFALSYKIGKAALWDGAHFGNVFSILFFMIGIGFGLTSLGLFIDKDYRGTRTTRHWRRLPIGGYFGSVPDFILNKAVEIKSECPKADIWIDQLIEDREEQPRPDPDPFLVVSLGTKESYYIDVWNEKDYEADR